MQSCNISHQIVESISCHSSCSIKVNSVKRFHNLCMIRDFKIRNNRLSKSLYLNIFTVIFSDRYRRINNIWNDHHILFDLFFYLFFFFRKFIDSSVTLCYFLFQCFCFFKLLLSHHCTNLFGGFIFLCTKCLYFLLDFSVSFIQFDHFIYQRKFFILKLILNILFYNIRIAS